MKAANCAADTHWPAAMQRFFLFFYMNTLTVNRQWIFAEAANSICMNPIRIHFNHIEGKKKSERSLMTLKYSGIKFSTREKEKDREVVMAVLSSSADHYPENLKHRALYCS